MLEELREGYQAQPAEHYRSCRCGDVLADTSHFHIDPFGNLFTGLCPGVVAGKIGDLCTDIRRHLHARGGFDELAPDAFYAN